MTLQQKLILIFLVLMGLLAPRVFAQTPDDKKQVVLGIINDIFSPEGQDRAAYNFVKSTCHSRYNQGGVQLSEAFKIFKDEALFVGTWGISGGDEMSMAAHIKSKGLNPFVYQLLQSQGYYQALRECFPDPRTGEQQRNMYTKDLLAWDFLGKFTGAYAVRLQIGIMWEVTQYAPLWLKAGTTAMAGYQITKMIPTLTEKAIHNYHEYLAAKIIQENQNSPKTFDETLLKDQAELYVSICNELKKAKPNSSDYQDLLALQTNTRQVLIQILQLALENKNITTEQRQRFSRDLQALSQLS
jgi:hypothetical protein